MANRLDRGWQNPTFPKHLECVLAVGSRPAEPIMDRDDQVAATVRMYGCNLKSMSYAMSEGLDKAGASMYGN
jgi:hypothetical protein